MPHSAPILRSDAHAVSIIPVLPRHRTAGAVKFKYFQHGIVVNTSLAHDAMAILLNARGLIYEMSTGI